MNKKVVVASLSNMTSDTKIKVLELYKYASMNRIEDVVLFSNGIFGNENSLEELVTLIPNSDSNIRTCLFLGTEDIYYLSPNSFSKALNKRSDININLSGFMTMNVDGKILNFFNENTAFEMSEDDLKGVYSDDKINVFASKIVHGCDQQTFLSGRNKIFVGPVKASMFDIQNGTIIYNDLNLGQTGFEVEPASAIFTMGKEREYTKKR